MNLKEVEELVNYYEKRILTEFDKHFGYLVLEDFYTGGYNDRISDEDFYEEYFERYENGVINLLLEIEDCDEEYEDFRFRLIKLKRIIDTKLNSIKHKLGELNSTNRSTRQPRISYFILNDNVEKISFIESLYTQLKNSSFIDCELESFSNLFNRVYFIEKIQWLGTELQLAYFINQLINFSDKDVDKRKYVITKEYFFNKNGKEFKSSQLNSVFADKKELLPDDDAIKLIMEKMSANF